MTCFLIRIGDEDTNTQRKDHVKTKGKTANNKKRTEASE